MKFEYTLELREISGGTLNSKMRYIKADHIPRIGETIREGSLAYKVSEVGHRVELVQGSRGKLRPAVIAMRE